jgi:acyl dehydratase
MNWIDALKEMPHLQSHQDSGLVRLEEDGTTTKILVHGILVSSIFSSIFATLVPGCVYMNQTLNFAGPVYADEMVLGRVEIEKVRKWRKGGVVVQCDTQVVVSSSQTPVVKGTANVWLPSGYSL